MVNKLFRAGMIALCVVVAGCTTMKQTKDKYATASTRADEAIEKAKKTAPADPIAEVEPGIFLGGRSSVNDNGSPLPREWERPNAFGLGVKKAMTLAEYAGLVAKRTGIQVVIGDMEGNAPPASARSAMPGANAATVPVPTPGADIIARANGGVAVAAVAASSSIPTPSAYLGPASATVPYDGGPISGFFDRLGEAFNANWRYKDGVVTFYRYEARTFSVYALPTTMNIQSSVRTDVSASGDTGGNGGNGGGGTRTQGAASQSTKYEADVKPWEELKAALEKMAPVGSGTAISVSPGLGTVTVYGPRTVTRRIGEWIADQNERFGRQVTVEAVVLTINHDRTDDYGLDLTALMTRSNGVVTTLGGPKLNLSDAVGKLSMAVVNAPAGSKFASWNGSSAIVQFLTEEMHAVVETNAVVTTANNRPAPVAVNRQTGYIPSVIVSQTAQVGTMTQITPGVINTGFNLIVLPRVLTQGNLMLEVNVSLSSLRKLDTYSPDGKTTVQVPTVDSRSFVNEALLRSGSTLVLSGFAQDDDSALSDGAGPVPTGVQGATHKTKIVVLLTPRILPSVHDEVED